MEKPTSRGRGYKVAAIGVAALSSLFFLQEAIRHFRDIPPLPMNAASLIVAAASMLLVVVNASLGGVIWRLLLGDNGVATSWTQALRIFLVSQLGKYLPGNVGQHVGRVVMGREAGFPAAVVVGTMVVETLWNVGVGAGMALLSVLLFVDGHRLGQSFWIGPVELGVAAVILMASPWLGIGLMNRWLPNVAHRLSGQGSLPLPRLGTALAVAMLFVLNFVVMGLILRLQAQFFFGSTAVGLAELTCLFAVAWLGGYLMPGAPGGLGVRESLMVLLFTPVLGAGMAVGLGITLRITTTAGDAFSFLLGLLLRHAEREGPENAP